MDWVELLKDYHGKDLDSRKTWYGSVVDVYNRVRPRYPLQIIARVVELAQLFDRAHILELGCGPGIATLPFAQLGFSLHSLEPNQEAAQIAKDNCANYPNVEIQNISFEEWELEYDRFDAVLAATSWHWITPEVAYSKTVAALKENGWLILLWNTPPHPSDEICQRLDHVYDDLNSAIPIYARYEDRETHTEHFRKFGQDLIDSSCFKDLVYEYLVCEVTYSIDDYLALLSTLSAYIALESYQRDALFDQLKTQLEKVCGDLIPLSYLSAFHVAQKI